MAVMTAGLSNSQMSSKQHKPKKLGSQKLKKRLPKKLNTGTAEVGPNSLYLRVEIESTDNQRKYGVRALVDSGATGLFIDTLSPTKSRRRSYLNRSRCSM
jgi:hypothetical protein